MPSRAQSFSRVLGVLGSLVVVALTIGCSLRRAPAFHATMLHAALQEQRMQASPFVFCRDETDADLTLHVAVEVPGIYPPSQAAVHFRRKRPNERVVVAEQPAPLRRKSGEAANPLDEACVEIRGDDLWLAVRAHWGKTAPDLAASISVGLAVAYARDFSVREAGALVDGRWTRRTAGATITTAPASPLATIAALKSVDVSALSDGHRVSVSGYAAPADGAGGDFVYAANSTLPGNGGTVIAPLSGKGRWLRDYTGPVNVKWFGAKGDGQHDDAPAIQAAVSLGDGIGVEFPSGTFRTTSPITYSPTASRIRMFSRSGAIIRAAHNGDCIVATTHNENFGRHTWEGLTIEGPNNWSAGRYTSEGAAIKMHSGGSNQVAGYSNAIRDCEILGFRYGLSLQAVIGLTVGGKTFIQFNEYGIWIDGGQTNANFFNGTVITYNRIAGVYSTGNLAPALTVPTMNVFHGCLIESNRPSAKGSGAPADSMGIYLKRSENWTFRDCYLEDHDFGVFIDDSSSANTFDTLRLAPGPSGLCRIGLKGTNLFGNLFYNCSALPTNATDQFVQVGPGNGYNQFINCSGLNFVESALQSETTIINNRPYADGLIKNFDGSLVMPSQGYVENAVEGTARRTIDGIGTAAATMNLAGVGEFQLGNGITGDTTITSFSGLRAGQVFAITNYQNAHRVTLKSADSPVGNIVLQGGDVVMDDYGQQVFFFVTGQKKAYEVGRNFVPVNQVTGGGRLVRSTRPVFDGGSAAIILDGGNGPSAPAFAALRGTTAARAPQEWYAGVNVQAGDGSYEIRNRDGDGLRLAPGTGYAEFSAYGAGSASFDAAGNLHAVSDVRLKAVQGAFTRGLADVLGIAPIRFRYTPESGLDQSAEYAGFSAQNILENIPEAVGKSPAGHLSVQDRAVMAALVNAVKQLHAQVVALGGNHVPRDASARQAEAAARQADLDAAAAARRRVRDNQRRDRDAAMAPPAAGVRK